MKASHFFKTAISDNNYKGIAIADIDPVEDFFVNAFNKHDQPLLRKQGVVSFVKQVYQNCASNTLAQLGVKPIRFDDEFDANTEQPIFTISGDDFDNLRIYTGNIVGSLVLDGSVININSRFGNDFLQYMIAYTSGFLELENFGGFSMEVSLGEWLLIYYWKLQLKHAYALGLYKTYQKKQESLVAVRGQIDINKWVQKSYFDGKTQCNYKEHSYSNEINVVIDMALRKVFNSKYQSIVLDMFEIKRAFASLNLKPLKVSLLGNNKVSNPYFQKYNHVYGLSLRILKDEFSSIGEKSSQLSAFLFDVSLLFEHHIRKLLKTRFKLTVKNRIEYTIPNGISKNALKPDVIIEYGTDTDGRKNIAIYDVKYKHFNSADGVDRIDLFQLITYVSTYMNDYNVVKCGFIYPCKEIEFNGKDKKIQKEQPLMINGISIPFDVKLYKVSELIAMQSAYDLSFVNTFLISI